MSVKKVSTKNKKMSRTHSVPDIFILPKTTKHKLPYFAVCVVEMLSKHFPKTYVVGGAVRNLLLKQKVGDTDIATSAKPEQVMNILKMNGIKYSGEHKKFGVIIAKSNAKQTLEIATFRTDTYGKNRFPKVSFITSPAQDSRRRDFTINALYYSLSEGAVMDFNNGLDDILNNNLAFIGNAKKRIQEDPLRIVRAYRLSLQYNLEIDKSLENILQSNLHLLKKVSAARIEREIKTVTSKKIKEKLQKVIHRST
ncbi:MAG TPA: hypothetical protein VHQ41_02505 [Patescibacteria group bacterium]|jgi:tRNA nucleotidyltransferase (CCA-adding enzyme)|nr:hypothetical protein [Patescibacteria group bacterium]